MNKVSKEFSWVVITKILLSYKKLVNKYRLHGLRVVLFGNSSSFAIYLLFSVFILSLIGFFAVEYFQKQTAELDKSMSNYNLVRTVFADGSRGNSTGYFSNELAELVEQPLESIKVDRDAGLPVTKSNRFKNKSEVSHQPDKSSTVSKQVLEKNSGALISSSQSTNDWVVTKQQQDSAIQHGYAALYYGDLNIANLHFIQALQMEPNNYYALNGLAATQSKLGMNEAALKSYQKVLVIDPTNLHAFESVLVMLGSRIEGPEWKRDIKKILTIYPNSAILNAVLGHFSASELDWKTAQDYYFKAYTLDRQSADYSLNLAVSLDHLGEYLLAQKYYSMALNHSKSQALSSDTSPIKLRLRALKQFAELAGK